MKKLLSALVLAVSATAAQAGPSISIGTVYDYMDGDKSTYLKRVFNGGDSTAFVRVNIYEMTFDAAGNATEAPLDNQDNNVAQRKGLVASPARLIVPAKGMQATRLLYIGERDRERYYRVRFLPVVPEKADQFNVTDEERDTYKESMSAGVNVMTGYGAIFFVRPKNTLFDTKIQDGPTEYRVENAGNSTIELDEFKDCSAKKESDCQATKKHLLRPGKVFSFVKESGRVYRFNLIEGSVSKKIEVK
ncbi:molecular chaperone [Pseudomonas sp. IPO3774]|uniref:molecular chaperone n=1 Tax=Pseudomonas sp. IPO3774 TaxID=2738826 RepID=UPI0015A2A130|nr:molecular chaperone [Pseudomonas sp. IPO3774]NWD65966.1 molecular chaperone [Pseudomonas sp. IPO3774]